MSTFNLKWHHDISKDQANNKMPKFVRCSRNKPRTDKEEAIIIKKVKESYFTINHRYLKNKKIKSIKLTNPLLKITKTNKIFTLCDGQYQFSIVNFSKNYIFENPMKILFKNQKD